MKSTLAADESSHQIGFVHQTDEAVVTQIGRFDGNRTRGTADRSRRRRSMRLWVLTHVVLVGIVSSACGSTAGPAASPPVASSSAEASPFPSPTGTVQPSSSPATAPNPLLGTWRRTGSCKAFVGAMDAAGLIDLVGTVDDKWMGGGITPGGTDPTAADYCRGATAVVHSHFFTPDGRFGSYDENGQQVDDGTYELRGDDEIVFGKSLASATTIIVTYRIDATDHLSFLAVSAPECSAGEAASPPAGSSGVGVGTCRWEHGWAISAFYPGSYQRVH